MSALPSRRRIGAVGTMAVALIAALTSTLVIGGSAIAAPARVSAADIAANTDYLGWHFETGTGSNTLGGLSAGASGDTYVLNGLVAAGAPGIATTPAALETVITATNVVASGDVLLQFPYSVTTDGAPATIVSWGTLRTAAPVTSGIAPTADTQFISSKDLGSIPNNTAAPLSAFIAEFTALDAANDVRYSGYGFWASLQAPAAEVQSITSSGATTSFGIPPLTITAPTATVVVPAAEIRADESTYPGWHEGRTAPVAPFTVDAAGLNFGGATASQIINGLATPKAVGSLDALVALVGTYSLDVTSGAVHAQLPFFFGAADSFTTLRSAAPVATGTYTPTLAEDWMSSRDIPATATTPAIAKNTSVSLGVLLDALAAQGNVRVLAFGVYTDPSAAPAVVKSVSFDGTKYEFGVVTTTPPVVEPPVVVPPVVEPPAGEKTTTPAVVVVTTKPASAAPGKELADSGSSDSFWMTAVAGSMLALGAVGVLIARRNRAGLEF